MKTLFLFSCMGFVAGAVGMVGAGEQDLPLQWQEFARERPLALYAEAQTLHVLAHPSRILVDPAKMDFGGSMVVGICAHPGGAGQFCFLTQDGQLMGGKEGGEVKPIFEKLPKAIGMGAHGPNFRALFSSNDRLYVANDVELRHQSFPQHGAGRLAYWDWRGHWQVVDTVPYLEVAGITSAEGERFDTIFALGYDDISGLLRVFHHSQWRRYRLPWSHGPQGDGAQRLREIAEGKWLMMAFDNLYELTPPTMTGAPPLVRAKCALAQPLRDVCPWRGGLALLGKQKGTAPGGAFVQEVKLEEFLRGRTPVGRGAAWKNVAVRANDASEPFLMAGFDKKTLHLQNHSNSDVCIDIEVDCVGDGQFTALARIEIPPLSYRPYVFAEGYSAYWWRARAICDGVVSVQATYQ